MIKRQYSVGNLRRVIKESANEFKPVYGKNVESDNKKINDKAYSDMAKAVKDYDGGKTSKSKRKAQYPQDDNRGMENLQYDRINEPFAKKVKSQLKGYTSEDAEKKHKNDPYGNADFTEFDGMDEKDKRLKNGKVTSKAIGLTSREIDRKEFEKLSSSVFENKIKKLNFKNTTFLCESHMMTKVPDTYKVEGKRFIMSDRTNHEYLVEWHVEDDPKVYDKNKINEQEDTIKRLYEFKHSDEKSTPRKRLNEDAMISDMINNMRKLME